MDYSRRGFTGWMLALFFGPHRGSGSPDALPYVERYRADAASWSSESRSYKRPGVGSGQVSVEESGEGPEAARTLFFAAGSDPKRAHGLARLGWMRESALPAGQGAGETEYFGVLTSSPEESLDSIHKS